MTEPLLDADLVFGDLRDALAALKNASGSPKDIRRALSRFVDLTQRLTSAMRRDYSKLKAGEKWVASSFPGWDDVTDLFKWYRNEEQHVDQIYIAVRERRKYLVAPDSTSYLVWEGTWNLSDQNADEPPNAMLLCEADPVTGRMTNVALPPAQVENTYLFQARSKEAAERLRLVKTADVHRLSQSCFETLSQYYAFFKERTGRKPDQ